MLIYKDIFSGDDLFSDVYPIKERDGVFYEVTGKLLIEKGRIDGAPIGANASAEEAAESTEESSLSGCDIVLRHSLKKVFRSKNEFHKDIRAYVHRLLKHLEEKRPDRVESFKAEAAPAVQKLLHSFDQWEFFLGGSEDATAMVALMDWKDDTTAYMLFFKDGLAEEKV